MLTAHLLERNNSNSNNRTSHQKPSFLTAGGGKARPLSREGGNKVNPEFLDLVKLSAKNKRKIKRFSDEGTRRICHQQTYPKRTAKELQSPSSLKRADKRRTLGRQADLGDAAGLSAGHSAERAPPRAKAHELFWSLEHTAVTFTLYHSLLSVQQRYSLKKKKRNCELKNTFLLRNANHHPSPRRAAVSVRVEGLG